LLKKRPKRVKVVPGGGDRKGVGGGEVQFLRKKRKL
jgi:hypothetical protein